MKLTTFEKYKCPNCGNEEKVIVNNLPWYFFLILGFIDNAITEIYLNSYRTNINHFLSEYPEYKKHLSGLYYNIYYLLFTLIILIPILFLIAYLLKKYPTNKTCCSCNVKFDEKNSYWEFILLFSSIIIKIIIISIFISVYMPNKEKIYENYSISKDEYKHKDSNSNKKLEKWLNIQNEQ